MGEGETRGYYIYKDGKWATSLKEKEEESNLRGVQRPISNKNRFFSEEARITQLEKRVEELEENKRRARVVNEMCAVFGVSLEDVLEENKKLTEANHQLMRDRDELAKGFVKSREQNEELINKLLVKDKNSIPIGVMLDNEFNKFVEKWRRILKGNEIQTLAKFVEEIKETWNKIK